MLHFGQVISDQRSQIRVHYRGFGPGQQLDERRQLRRTDHVLEAAVTQERGQFLLVLPVAIAVHQRHGRRADAPLEELLRLLRQSSAVQFPQHAAVRLQPFVHLYHRFVERRRLFHFQREQLRPLLVADPQQIAQPPGDEQRYPHPASFQQGVGPARRRQPHRHRRQVLFGGSPRCQPRRQQRCLF